MRGISDLDFVCLTEIFKNLKPLDFCSLRQCSKKLQYFVDDYFYSLYFVREQRLDIKFVKTSEKILKHFGKFVRHLKVFDTPIGPYYILDSIANNCGANNLKSLHLSSLLRYDFDMQRLTGVFDNLEILHLHGCSGGDIKHTENFLLGHEYPNLNTLKVHSSIFGSKVLNKFFMRKRKIKRLSCNYKEIRDDLLLLIALNAAEIEELDFWLADINFELLAQLRKLKRLKISCYGSEPRQIIALIEVLSVNLELEILFIDCYSLTNEVLDAVSNLASLKELRFMNVNFAANSIKPIEMMCQKMSKLESLRLVNCSNFPHRNFLASIRKSDKFRTIYIWPSFHPHNNKFIEQIFQDCMDIRDHRWLVSENALYIYLEEELFQHMKIMLTQENLKIIQKYRNIKIQKVEKSINKYSIKNV